MKILQLLPYLPVPTTSGGSLRIYHILKHLTRHHDVTVAGFSDTGDPDQFLEEFPMLDGAFYFARRPWKRRFRRLVQLYSMFTSHSFWYTGVRSNALQTQLDSLLSRQDFDLIQVEFPSMAIFRLNSDATKILDSHNVEYDNFRRMANLNWSTLRKYFYQREYEKFYAEEIAACQQQDAIFVTSERDRTLLDQDTPNTPKYVIPNGVNTSYFQPADKSPEPYSLVFTGMMGYVPNWDGIMYFLDDILPGIRKKIPQVKLYVVGKNPPKKLRERASENVIVTGYVDDVRPFIEKSSVYIVPLRMGGGTRLKILEALAMKKPVVTTSIGCEGIDVLHDENVLIADNPDTFADTVIHLIQDRALQDRLSRIGYEFVKSRYEWNVIGQQIDEAYSEIIRNSSPGNKDRQSQTVKMQSK